MKKLNKIRRMPATLFRAQHADNPCKCFEECRGWVISHSDQGRGISIEKCDECWSNHPAKPDVWDDDARALPEAQRELKRVRRSVRREAA